MAKKKSYTEQELKAMDKDGLIEAAESLGVPGVSNKQNMETIIKTIMDFQESGDQASAGAEGASADGASGDALNEPEEASGSSAGDGEAGAESDGGAEALDESGLIKVKAARITKTARGGWPQVFVERHSAHPNGWAFIANDKVHKVAETSAVKRAIVDGVLVEA